MHHHSGVLEVCLVGMWHKTVYTPVIVSSGVDIDGVFRIMGAFTQREAINVAAHVVSVQA